MDNTPEEKINLTIPVDIIDRAGRLARRWQDRANQLLTHEEKAIQEQMMRLLTHPMDKVVLTRLIPEADGTLCDQRIEAIAGTENARILRVPFRTYEGGEIIPQWISRFEIWPYLERFAVDAERELLAEQLSTPDAFGATAEKDHRHQNDLK